MAKKIGVLICDDSALMRRSLKKIIESDAGLHVIGSARDGEDAIVKCRELNPDVVTMDINMPGMDGLTALQLIVHEKIAPVLMVSSLTQEGAAATFEALALGAFDYVPKPGGTVSGQMASVSRELVLKIKAAAKTGVMSRLARTNIARAQETTAKPAKPAKPAGRLVPTVAVKAGKKVVALGISTGGPKTLLEILPLMPETFNAPFFIVQHMPPTFTASFAKRIDGCGPLRCVEAEAGMNVEPGVIYLGRGGYHLTVYKKPSGTVTLRTPTHPPHTFIPSVEVMMDSVREVYGAGTVGVLMTGMGDDGANAMVRIKQAGGVTIAESEDTAIVFGMPREAIERGGADIVVSSWDIVSEIVKAMK
ncbi:MAG: chemotaxis response regulator protein-glutamate methylesterase [Pseudomonadota bacterium]